MMDEDLDLLAKRAAGGDAAAFAALRTAMDDTLRRYLEYKVNDQQVAARLLDETFETAREAIAAAQPLELPIQHWFLRVARNRVLRHYKG